MRKALLVGCVVLVSASFVNAQTLLSDDFTYGGAAGDLTAVSGGAWVSHSGTTAVAYQTSGLSMAGYDFAGAGGAAAISSANSQDVNRSFAAQSGTVYYSALVRISTASTFPGSYFLHLKDAANNFGGRIWVMDDGAGALRFTVRGASGDPLIAEYPAATFSYNTTYLVVVRYNRTTGAAALHVLTSAPVSEPVTPHATATATLGADMEAIAIRQGTSGAATLGPTAVVDGIRVGLTWETTVVPVELMSFSVE